MRASIRFWRWSGCRRAFKAAGLERLARRGVLLVALALAACGGDPAGARLASTPTDYRLGPGDRLRVEVFNEPDLSGDYEVDAVGSVPLKLGGRIDAKGLTSRELELAIARRL